MLDFHVAKGKSTDALSEARWPDGKGRIDRAYTLAGERLWRRPSWESHLPVPYKGRNSPHKPTLLQKAEHSPRSGQWPELHWIKLGRLSPNKAVQSGVFSLQPFSLPPTESPGSLACLLLKDGARKPQASQPCSPAPETWLDGPLLLGRQLGAFHGLPLSHTT